MSVMDVVMDMNLESIDECTRIIAVCIAKPRCSALHKVLDIADKGSTT